MKKYLSFVLLFVMLSGCCYLDKRPVLNNLENQETNLEFLRDAHSIYFKFNSSKLEDEGTERLNSFISKIPNNYFIVVMRGYANKAEQRPKQISMKRIQTIKQKLIQSGITPAQIKVQALGTADPLISYDTADNNAKSRRVDLFIQNR